MKLNKKILVLAMAAALPCFSAHAQSAAELQKEMEVLKAQLKMLSDKIEAMAAKPAAVDPQEFNRLVQKIDLTEEDAIKAGFKGMKFKGVLDVGYSNDEISAKTGFDKARGNGGNGAAMFEISKEPDEGIGWMLRLTPLSSTSIVQEASLSVPVGSGSTKLIAGLTPDYSGYELSWGNANPLISNNLLYTHSAATNYMGAGLSYAMGPWSAKWMVGQVDGVATRSLPGLAYRADYSVSEFSGIGFSGVHVRTNNGPGNVDLMEVYAYHNRGDLTVQGQLSLGRLAGDKRHRCRCTVVGRVGAGRLQSDASPAGHCTRRLHRQPSQWWRHVLQSFRRQSDHRVWSRIGRDRCGHRCDPWGQPLCPDCRRQFCG